MTEENLDRTPREGMVRRWVCRQPENHPTSEGCESGSLQWVPADETYRDVKQVIVIRRDLKMRRGKEIAQGSHASIAFLSKWYNGQLEGGLSDAAKQWLGGYFGSHKSGFKKVCCRVDSEQEVLDLDAKARGLGLLSIVITDEGLTEFGGEHTVTCMAIGPDYSDEVDEVTGHLPLY